MASFGPQVKNMAQVGAGGEERKPLRREKGRYGVHRSDSLSHQSRPACSHHRPVPFRTQGSAKAFPVKSCRPPCDPFPPVHDYQPAPCRVQVCSEDGSP